VEDAVIGRNGQSIIMTSNDAIILVFFEFLRVSQAEQSVLPSPGLLPWREKRFYAGALDLYRRATSEL
jgi:hypothetical protein